jgi:hypothetical protein
LTRRIIKIADEPKTIDARKPVEEKGILEAKPFSINYDKFYRRGMISTREAYELKHGLKPKTRL